MKNTFLIFVLLVSVILQACNQTTEETVNDLNQKNQKPEGIMAYYNAFTQPVDGKFMLKSYTTLASQDFDGSNVIEGYFFDKNGKPVAGGEIKLGNLSLKPDTKNSNCFCSDYRDKFAGKSLHGNTIKISITPPPPASNLRVSANDTTSSEIYIPILVKITTPSGFVNSPDQPFMPLKAGDQIGWNVDEKNKKGVIILLQYDPLHENNKYLQAQGVLVNKTAKVAKAITVNDYEGVYTYSSDDLKDFPANAYVSLTIGRANFDNLKSGDANYMFYAYTVVDSNYQLKR